MKRKTAVLRLKRVKEDHGNNLKKEIHMNKKKSQCEMLTNSLCVCNNARLATMDEIIEVPHFDAAVDTRTEHPASACLQAANSTAVTSTSASTYVNYYHHCFVLL